MCYKHNIQQLQKPSALDVDQWDVPCGGPRSLAVLGAETVISIGGMGRCILRIISVVMCSRCMRSCFHGYLPQHMTCFSTRMLAPNSLTLSFALIGGDFPGEKKISTSWRKTKIVSLKGLVLIGRVGWEHAWWKIGQLLRISVHKNNSNTTETHWFFIQSAEAAMYFMFVERLYI